MTKLCKDCKHYGKNNPNTGYYNSCLRKPIGVDLVTGQVEYEDLYCYSQRNMPTTTWWRKPNSADYCGTEAQYFEPKEDRGTFGG